MRCRKNHRTLALLVTIVLAGCGDESAATGSSTRTRTGTKDRGEAAMTLGAASWQASSAKAKLANGTLTIRAGKTDRTDGRVTRQELHLQVSDFTGPGDYKTGFSGSRFLGVGLDVEAAKAAGDEQAAATETVTDALTKAKHLMLSGAMVKVTAASDTEVTGTFSWSPPAGIDQPAITNGTFRALLDQ
jgi:hypothetical protein